MTTLVSSSGHALKLIAQVNEDSLLKSRHTLHSGCTGADHIDASSFKVLLDAKQTAARAKFHELIADRDPREAFITSRHRTHLSGRSEHFDLPVPRFMRMFDWYMLGDNVRSVSKANPKTVLCRANLLRWCWDAVKGLPALEEGETRVLAIGQEDTNMSENVEAMKIFLGQNDLHKRLFSKILYEAKDIEMEGIGTFPIGLNDAYITMNGPSLVMQAIREADLQKKDKVVFAAWGKIWGTLDHKLKSRIAAEKFTNSSCFINRSSVEMKDYWRTLARHRFLLAPSGKGVQSPKVVEALLVLTIPIVDRKPAWEDMKNAGWPIAMVDRWDEITPQKLVEWHKELSPRLEAFRLNLTTWCAFHYIVGTI